MKRLLKVFAFLGGLGAVGWLVRSRFVGMTLNREPQTPEPAPEPVPGPRPESDLLQIPGLSPAAAELLQTAGVDGVAQLADASAAELATRTGLDEALLTSWIDQAAVLV
jgi:predicted flap endonuclease-1-like 5' DNA nuclease